MKAILKQYPEYKDLKEVDGTEFHIDGSLLHHAARYQNDPDMITVLVKSGFNVNQENENLFTPLHLAAQYNENPKIVKALVKKGARVDFTPPIGWTPLHLAAGYNTNADVITALIKAGSNVAAVDRMGDMPLHWAALNENLEVCARLIKAGAPLDVP